MCIPLPIHLCFSLVTKMLKDQEQGKSTYCVWLEAPKCHKRTKKGKYWKGGKSWNNEHSSALEILACQLAKLYLKCYFAITKQVATTLFLTIWNQSVPHLWELWREALLKCLFFDLSVLPKYVPRSQLIWYHSLQNRICQRWHRITVSAPGPNQYLHGRYTSQIVSYNWFL